MKQDPNRQQPNSMRPEIEHPRITEIEQTTQHPDHPRVDNQSEPEPDE